MEASWRPNLSISNGLLAGLIHLEYHASVIHGLARHAFFFFFLCFISPYHVLFLLLLLLLSGNAYERFIQVNPVVYPGSSCMKWKEVYCSCWRQAIPFDPCN